jgi:hypothetical protein
MIQHYARICWNKNGWTKPSGSAGDGPKTFFGKYGFGMEEWLFDPSAQIDGWQYGFLQPVNKGYQGRIGDLLALRLYAIPGGGVNRYREEFQLSRCEVLTPSQAHRIHDAFRKSGRIQRMVDEVRAVRGNPEPLIKGSSHFENVINVRFRPGDGMAVSHRQPTIRADYYRLYKIPGEIEVADTHPDEIMQETSYWEGALKQVIITVFERDRRARRECLDNWGYKCQVCGMSFADRYGPVGKEFIHVHHLIPISTIKKSYRIDGKKDLRPVCPNCHAMLHHGKIPPTIEELRMYITNAREKKDMAGEFGF